MWNFQPFAGHKGLRKALLREELALVQVLVGGRRVVVKQKQLLDPRLLGELHHVVSNKRIAPELARLNVRFIDPGALIGDERWTKIYEDTIYGRNK